MRRGLKTLHGQDDSTSLRGIVQQLLKTKFITEDDFLLENMKDFTPTLFFAVAPTTPLTANIRYFKYIVLGNICFIYFKIDITTTVAGNDIRMTLPASPLSVEGHSQRTALYLNHNGTDEDGGLGFVNDGTAFMRRPAVANFAIGSHVVGSNCSYLCQKN
jgi:hypothetical protein